MANFWDGDPVSGNDNFWAADPVQSSPLGDIAKSAGIGLAKGAIGLLGLPADLTNLGTKGYDYLTGSNSNAAVTPFVNNFGSQALQNATEKETGKFYEPQTTLGKYAQTIGEFAPAVVGGPGGLIGRAATRVAIPAVASEAAGQATEGTKLEPFARLGGALLGAGLPVAASRAVSPITADAGKLAAAQVLKDYGVDVTAGEATGSKALKIAENELGNAPFAGGQATAANTRTMEQYTAAALNKAGIQGVSRATPDVMDNAFDANGQIFDQVAARNPTIPLPKSTWGALQGVADDYENLTGQKSPLLANLMDRLGNPAINPTVGNAGGTPNAISGPAYQSIRSDISKYQRSAPAPLKGALGDFRTELDNGVGQGLAMIGNPQDADIWQQARGQYRNLLVVERALANSTEAANQGLITPTALANADKAIAGKRAYVRGTSTFSDLAHAGNAVLKPEANSNTSARWWAHALPSALGAMLGAGAEGFTLGGALGGAGAAIGPGILGRAIMSRQAQSYLANQLAAPLRMTIPLRRNLISSGILSLPGVEQTQ